MRAVLFKELLIRSLGNRVASTATMMHLRLGKLLVLATLDIRPSKQRVAEATGRQAADPFPSIEVLKGQPCDLASAQTEASEQQHNGTVSKFYGEYKKGTLSSSLSSQF